MYFKMADYSDEVEYQVQDSTCLQQYELDFIQACFEGELKTVQKLCSNHPDLPLAVFHIDGYKRKTGLTISAKEGNYEVVEFLLQSGADTDQTNHKGRTAYHLALKHGFRNVCNLIRKYRNVSNKN